MITKSGPVIQDLVQQNQAALMAVQGGAAGDASLRKQIISLTKKLEDMREKHQYVG